MCVCALGVCVCGRVLCVRVVYRRCVLVGVLKKYSQTKQSICFVTCVCSAFGLVCQRPPTLISYLHLYNVLYMLT